MKSHYKKLILGITLFSGCFAIVMYIFQHFLSARFFTYIANLYSPVEGDFWVSFIVIFLLSFYTAYFLFVLITRTSYRWISISFYLFYFLTLVYFLFFKSIGFRGVSFNPFHFILDISNGNGLIELFFNILYFIPLGFLLGQKIVVFLIGIFFVEVIQYSFSLGVFDLSDILLNLFGFYLGIQLQNTFLHKLFFPDKHAELEKRIDNRELLE